MKITVSSKGRVTLPAEVRRRLGIRAGTRLEVIVTHDDRLEMARIDSSIRDLEGLLPKAKRKLTLGEMDEAIARGAADR